MASGRNFCCSSINLHKKWKNARLAFVDKVLTTLKGSIKVCPTPLVSFPDPKSLFSIEKCLCKKFKKNADEASAVACPAWPGEKLFFLQLLLNEQKARAKLGTGLVVLALAEAMPVGRNKSNNTSKSQCISLPLSVSQLSHSSSTLIEFNDDLYSVLNSNDCLVGSTLLYNFNSKLTNLTNLTTVSTRLRLSRPLCLALPSKTKGSSLKTIALHLLSPSALLIVLFKTKGSTLKTKGSTLKSNTLHPLRNTKSYLLQLDVSLRSQYKSASHECQVTKLRLMSAGDVERNPGPAPEVNDQRAPPTAPAASAHQTGPPLMMTTYNVRGLNDENKLRHLLNYFHRNDGGKSVDNIVCLQETYVDSPGKIPYIWRGNYFLTPGTGNSCGCLTLLSPHLSVVSNRQIGNRAHVIACQRSGETNVSLIVANIYAPNANTREKIDFFEEIFDLVRELEDTYNCSNSFILGDFNLIFNQREGKNRNFPSQEQRVASTVKAFAADSDLKDIWLNNQGFTWHRPNSDTFSTIDRILYPPDKFLLAKLKVNWSLSYSDHAALETSFTQIGKKDTPKSRITRLDPHLAKDPWTRERVINEYNEMISTMPTNWDPHKKLEFAKLCIRTVCENIQAERKRREASEEDYINEELDTALSKLASGAVLNQGPLIDYVEELRNRKQVVINTRGERLADKLGTKWYNEGEKSTKYFMRLLNRSLPDNFKKIELDDGSVITDPEMIEDEIVRFYRKLYEDYTTVIADSSSDADFFNNLTPISGADSDCVTKEITENEMATTLASCKDSAPGPDGIPYSILRLLWYSFGTILCESWRYSLTLRRLPESHKMSYLRLIPKAGKDLTKLTNWRPITLSNCDHKLITKIYAKRMCENVAKSIAERQTAYLKGRLINDNVRAILSTINITNVENLASGLIVALDAKKAFDSVDHNYIREVLRRFGCEAFVPIFDTLYAGLETSILVNGKISKSYRILRGVKQGDSLSCIIFIMCMEPLLCNIEANANIAPINSQSLDASLPKVYAYADDVNGTVKDTDASLQSFFDEYGRLTKLSGLELNADKTEVMRLGANPQQKTYKINYLGQEFEVSSRERIKINGILFHRNQDQMVDENVAAAKARIDSNLAKWSRRGLSTLGKILIVKTFGISQIIYLMQSIVLKNSHIKVLNAILYKFIWNRHYQAAKAPERIKRIVTNTPVKLGGLGMLDISLLDEGLKVKALGRLIDTCHPFLLLIKAKLALSDFFYPDCSTKVDPVISQAIASLKKYREGLWKVSEVQRSRTFLMEVNRSKISTLISGTGRASISYFLIQRSGKRLLGELNARELNNLNRYIAEHKVPTIAAARTLNGNAIQGAGESLIIQGKFKHLKLCSSKLIRETLSKQELITEYKVGLTLTRGEALNWANRISKLSSVRHRSTMLRIAHGDIYTNEKLFRFGLTDSDKCDRCDETDTLRHKFVDCAYVKEIWKHLYRLTNTILTNNPNRLDPVGASLGTSIDTSPTVTAINAEILQRILSLKKDQNYLIHPKRFVENSLKLLIRREKATVIKNEITSLLALLV